MITQDTRLEAGNEVSEQAAQFLKALFAPDDLILFRPIETWTDGNGKRCSQVVFRHVSHRRLGLKKGSSEWTFVPAKKLIDELNCVGAAHKANIFFGVAPRYKGDSKYDEAWQIRTVRILWADLDNTSPEQAADRCEKAAIPPPSIIVRSGNGVHLYWLLDTPYLIDDCGPPPAVEKEYPKANNGEPASKPLRYFVAGGERIYLDRLTTPSLSDKALLIQDIVSGIAHEIGGDHTHDLARILRVPGTMNRKDERNGRKPLPCVLHSCDESLRYPLSLFEKFAEHDKKRRQAIKTKAVQLPKERKKLTTAMGDRLGNLINECLVAAAGDRSERDFDLCCNAVRHGWPKEEVWQRSSGAGKFAEGGRDYFDRTWSKAEDEVRGEIYDTLARRAKHEDEQQQQTEPSTGDAAAGIDEAELDAMAARGDFSFVGKEEITNGYYPAIGGEGDGPSPLSLTQIEATLLKRFRQWPALCGDTLFVPSKNGKRELKNAKALFSWYGKFGIVRWSQSSGKGFVVKDEFFESLQATAPQRYVATEEFPHWPAVPGHFYLNGIPQAGRGECLERLLDRFAPETSEDRQLLAALFATVIWGGPPGTRPAFLISADAGRGTGKSKLVTVGVSHLLNDQIFDFETDESAEAIKKRVLTESAGGIRIALLDNVKTEKLSWAFLEKLTTSRVISGHRMFAGEAQRMNRLAWVLTMNGGSLSTDLAQRVVNIKLSKPQFSATWEEDTLDFIAANRAELLADLVGLLQRPPAGMEYSRVGAWERGVLSRLENPTALTRLIAKRQAELDAGADESIAIEELFAQRLREVGYDPDCNAVLIPTSDAARWLSKALGQDVKPIGCGRRLNQMIREGAIKRLTENRNKSFPRGFVWKGECYISGAIKDDLPERIKNFFLEREREKENFIRGTESWQ